MFGQEVRHGGVCRLFRQRAEAASDRVGGGGREEGGGGEVLSAPERGEPDYFGAGGGRAVEVGGEVREGEVGGGGEGMR